MFANYKYFLAIAEECNLSRAADKLFLTHQNLSKYLSRLESELGVTLCNRRPVFSLTPAGELLVRALRKAELAEQDFRSSLADLREETEHEVRLGATEGRFQISIPDLVGEFDKAFPYAQLKITSADSRHLCDMLSLNQIDIIILNYSSDYPAFFRSVEVLREHLYLVISDNMLERYFPEKYPECKEEFKNGADLREFTSVPFSMNLPDFRSHIMIKEHTDSLGISLNVIHMSSHPHLHHVMSARDYAASFCLTMYLPNLIKVDREAGGVLNVFPIKGLTATNSVIIAWLKERELSKYARELIAMVKRKCKAYAKYDAMIPYTTSSALFDSLSDPSEAPLLGL